MRKQKSKSMQNKIAAIEGGLDAQERFERAVDIAVATKPLHRTSEKTQGKKRNKRHA